GCFNKAFGDFVSWYRGALEKLFRRARPDIVVYAIIIAVLAILFLKLPTSFLPEEDQGIVIAQALLPPRAVESRTLAVLKQNEHHFLVDEKKNTESIFTVAGFSFSGQGQNTGIGFVHLTSWDQRKGEANHAPVISARTMAALSRVRDAQVFALVLPAVPELG